MYMWDLRKSVNNRMKALTEEIRKRTNKTKRRKKESEEKEGKEYIVDSSVGITVPRNSTGLMLL